MNFNNININRYYFYLLLIYIPVFWYISAESSCQQKQNNPYKKFLLQITGTIFASAGISSLPTPYNYKEYKTGMFFSDRFREYLWWEKDRKKNFNLHINLIAGICSFYLAYKLFKASEQLNR